MKKIVKEFLYGKVNEEYEDDWYKSDEDENAQEDEILPLDDDLIPDELYNDDEIVIDDETDLLDILNNEIKVAEFSRNPIYFKIKGDSVLYEGIPMANIRDEYFLFKILSKFIDNENWVLANNSMKKIKYSDIIIPNELYVEDAIDKKHSDEEE